MVMLIAGGSLSTGSHDPYCGTLMPLGPSTPSVGVKHKPRTNRRFLSILRGSAQQENPPVAVGDIFIRKTANSDRLLGFIVSPTSRSAAGADLLVTDQECRKAWSVQVKTNKKPANFWLVGAHTAKLKSQSHAYVFVNLRKEGRPEFIVASSHHVASHVVVGTSTTGSVCIPSTKRIATSMEKAGSCSAILTRQ